MSSQDEMSKPAALADPRTGMTALGLISLTSNEELASAPTAGADVLAVGVVDELVEPGDVTEFRRHSVTHFSSEMAPTAGAESRVVGVADEVGCLERG